MRRLSLCISMCFTLFFLSMPMEAWSPSSGSMLEDYRESHTATILENGHVLVVGGGTVPPGESELVSLDTCEIFDPWRGEWYEPATLPALIPGSTEVTVSWAEAVLTRSARGIVRRNGIQRRG